MSRRFEKLTRKEIDKLNPGKRLSERGITVERPADGDLRWSIGVMVDGHRIHRVIGLASEGVTRTQAEQFIEKVKTDAREGRLSLPKGRKLALTFSDAATDYVTRLKEEGGKNIKTKARQLRMYLIPAFGAMRLDRITTFTLGQYRKQRLEAGAAVATINREFATLSHILTKAVEWKWLDRVPCRPQRSEEPKGRIIALTSAECESRPARAADNDTALMAAAIGSSDPDLWLFVAFGLNTAMRHAEILAVRWDELDIERRRLFIADILRREREMRDDGEEWVFPSPHSDTASGHRASMRVSFKAAVISAGLDPATVTPHVMRHTAITNLVQAGVDLPTIQRISGHKKLAMVLRYAHVHDQHIDEAIRALGRTLLEQGGNEAGAPITQELHRRHPRAPNVRLAGAAKKRIALSV
jgi:integrase